MRWPAIRQEFILQVAIPIDAEVHRRHSGEGFERPLLVVPQVFRTVFLRNGWSLDIPHAGRVGAPQFAAAMVGIDVSGKSTPRIALIVCSEQDFARLGITEVGAVGIFLVYHEQFQSGAVGV